MWIISGLEIIMVIIFSIYFLEIIHLNKTYTLGFLISFIIFWEIIKWIFQTITKPTEWECLKEQIEEEMYVERERRKKKMEFQQYLKRRQLMKEELLKRQRGV